MGIAASPVKFTGSSKAGAFSDQEIIQVAGHDRQFIADWVYSTAKKRGVMVRRKPTDKFVKAVSRLSDGVVELDTIEELLVALGRAKVLSSYQRGLLQVHYLR